MDTVLVVADDQWVINDVEAGLSDRRMNVISITDPHEVLKAVVEETPDLLLIDMQVGSMGGMALTRSLKAQVSVGKADATPIILMIDREPDAFIARRAGADGWILKPFSPSELRAVRDTAFAAG